MPESSRDFTPSRKSEHIRITTQENVETGSTGFEDVSLVHKAVPELDFNSLNTETEFFKKKFSLPLMIAGMTGGAVETKEINFGLAEAAEKAGIGMGVGSQKAMIEHEELTETYGVRSVAPTIFLCGNIGLPKLKVYSVQQIEKMLRSIKADALCVHLNPAQELFQKDSEIEPDWTGCLSALKIICSELKYPVIAKEVGNGISNETAMQLKEAGVRAIDVGGSGGTSWVVIDGMRSGKDTTDFKNWGIPTAISILEAKKAGLPIIATGGLRSGLDIAKALVLGADLAGIALPFLKEFKRGGVLAVEQYIEKLERELRTAMFLSGCKSIAELKKLKPIITGKTKEWAEQRGL